MSDAWYIRVQGRVTGPHTQAEIELLIRRQRLGRHDEMSSDKKVWKRASELMEAFRPISTKKTRKTTPAAPQPIIEDPAASDELPADSDTRPELEFIELNLEPVRASSQAPWHYQTDGQPVGPVSQDELQRLLASGQLSGSDLIWTAGMESWQPARSVPDLLPQTRSIPGTHSNGPIFLESSVHSLVLGILGLTVLFGISSTPAVVLGHLSLSRIQREPDRYAGQGQAIAGLVTGYVGLVLVLILFAYVVISSGFLRAT